MKKRMLAVFLPLLIAKTLAGEIYDCFPFFNEWEVLEIRLNELYDHVDRFVIVESAESFRGLPKPFHFEEKRELYQKFADKISYIKVERHPEFGDNADDRADYQKNQVLRGLKQCKKDDIILFSDVDEIPAKEVIPEIVEKLKTNRFVAVRQKMYRHFLNRKCYDGGPAEVPGSGLWIGTIAAKYKDIKSSPNGYRIHISFSHTRPAPVIDGGWHFTSMGGFNRFIDKNTNWEHWRNAFPKTEEHWRGEVQGHVSVPIDDTYPQFVRENIDYLTNLGLIEERN